MGVIDYLVKRKLDRYGLVLTADDRVMSTRTGDVVGWTDRDVPPATARPSIASAAELMMVPQAVAVPSSAPTSTVDEDEWEWEIAMARARAIAAEQMQAAAVVSWPSTSESPRILSPAQKQLAVVRTQARRTPAPLPRVPRMARGTRSPTHDSETTVVTAPPLGDETSPYVTMPPEVKPVGYAHTRRVAAKQR